MNQKLITTYLILLTSIISFGQNQLDTVFVKYNISETDQIFYKIDTILFPSEMTRNLLIGTTIWKGSSNLYNSYYNNGLDLVNVKSSDCLGQVDEDLSRMNKGITEITNNDSTWVIKCIIADNCCYSFLCDIEVVKESVLKLNYNGYGTHCDCDCYFELTYTINKINPEQSENIKYIQIDKHKLKIKNVL